MHFNFCKFIQYFVDLCGNEISRCNISHCISKLSQPLKASKADVALLVSNCKANTQHYPTRTALKTHITQNNNADCFLHCMRSDSILPPSFPPSLSLILALSSHYLYDLHASQSGSHAAGLRS